MIKKVIARVGNIFCVEIDDSYKCYFQFVAYDKTQLNGQVIRVFKKRYPLDYIPNPDDIVQDEVSFYSHTIIRFGLEDNVWYKIGNSPQKGDVENIMFRLKGWKGKKCWKVWKINEEFQHVETLSDEIAKYNIGFIFPYKDIIAKIKTGHYINMIDD
jgi:hypothetical protein